MMKLLAFLKVSLKSVIKELPVFALTFAVYPIVLALIMGYVQKDMFTPSINDPIFSIVVVDEDNTTESKSLISFLKSEDISKVLTIVYDDSEQYDYTLRIPTGYEESLLGKKNASVKVEAEEKSSASMGNILVNIVDKYNMEKSQGLIIHNNTEKLNMSSENKDKLINELSTILNNAYTTNSIKTNIHNVKKALNSYEYYSISFFNFIFVMFLIAVINSEALEKEIGLYSRIMSTSMTKLEYFNYGFMSNYLQIIIASLLYIGAYKICGLSFKGSISLLLLIVLTQSLMVTSLGCLISILFKKKYGLPLVQIFLIFQVIFGGVVAPLDKWSGNAIFKFFAKYKPDILITNSYKNFILYNNLSTIYNYLLIMIGISFALYLINILAIKMKWGESR